MEGSFTFVIYDEMQKRVFAGRDKEGRQPLYWGATEQGQLLIGSELDDVDGCDPTATIFPPGEYWNVALEFGWNKGWGSLWFKSFPCVRSIADRQCIR